MDLQAFLVAITPQLEARAEVEQVEVALWEGGVRLSMQVLGGPLALKFRERIEGAAYATTPSTTVALDLPEGATLSERAEQVARAVLEVIRKVDTGDMVVPADTQVEDDPDEQRKPGVTEQRVSSGEASAALTAETLALACVADQTQLLTDAGLSGGTVAVLEGAGLAGGRDAAALAAHLADAAGAPVWLDARQVDVGALRAAVAAAHAAGVASVALRLDASQGTDAAGLEGVQRVVLEGNTSPEGVAAFVAAGMRTQVLLPGAYLADARCADQLAQVTAAGGEVVVVPDFVAVPLDELAKQLVALGRKVRVMGLPHCVAPEVRRAVPEAGLVVGDVPARVWADVCGICDAREGCPGVPSDAHEAWGSRGIRPVLRRS